MAGRSIVHRALMPAVFRIFLVSLAAGLVSYLVNVDGLYREAEDQLKLSTEQMIRREALPFQEVADIQRNFLTAFETRLAEPGAAPALAADFDRIFTRRDDGSYVQRDGIFEGRPLPDGRRFPLMSATYAPDTPPTEDIKARFALSFLLSSSFGTSLKGRIYNIYGVVPEKGFPIFQAADISKVFQYGGSEPFDLATYEFYSRGFAATTRETVFTRMYLDPTVAAWMTTICTPGAPGTDGRWRILACIDLPLSELMERMTVPALAGATNTIFIADQDGTLIYDADHTQAIVDTAGQASIRSLGLTREEAVLAAARSGAAVSIVTSPGMITAVGALPGTPWAIAAHYPTALMRPAILKNLGIVALLGLATLLVEVLVLRSILMDRVARPLGQLMAAIGSVGLGRVDRSLLPVDGNDEIGSLARAFAGMAERVDASRRSLEDKVRERTEALEVSNRKLVQLSTTDALTGIANRRHFETRLRETWRQAESEGTSIGLAMIDVDWFKRLNDLRGHQAGDECLRTVASRLAAAAPEGSTLARYGGEEFALLLPGTDGAGAAAVAEDLRAAVATPAIAHEASPLGRVSVSIGVAVCGAGGDLDPASLIRASDDALYTAKREGRDRVRSADPDGIGHVPPIAV